MENKIKLVADTISKEDINCLIEWLKTYPKLTKGNKTIEFEEKWAEWLGTKYAVFVNSGSSANLLMIYALIASGKLKNKKVVCPSLSWATDLSPLLQLGLEPILVDCNNENLSVNIKELEQIFINEHPSALILVSVLGLPPYMNEIIELCKKHDVILLEDVCESFGSKYNDKKLGTFGLMSSFSTYYGHHLSTIEGGMVCTDDEETYNLLKQLRSHGWDRDLSKEKQKELRKKWNVDDFSAFYTFYVPGFNLRSTDLQAVIGLQQIKKADEIVEKRNKNYHLFVNKLKKHTWVPSVSSNHFVSSFCIPIISKKKEQIVKEFQNQAIEVRPLICGQMGAQPFYVSLYGENKKPNVSLIDKYGFYIPNHPGLTEEEINFMCDIIINIEDNHLEN